MIASGLGARSPQAATTASVEPTLPISRYLESLQASLHSSPSLPAALWELTPNRSGQSACALAQLGSENPAQFCAVARSACFALGIQVDGSCMISSTLSPSRASERFASLSLRSQMVDYALSRFEEYTHSPELGEACCGDDEVCRTRFTETRLSVLRMRTARAAGADADDAYYDGETHGVVIKPTFLIELNTRENIDSLLLHELGHACQASILSARVPLRDRARLRRMSDEQYIRQGAFAMDRVLGAETSACIQDAVTHEIARTHLPKTSVQMGYAEAFADAVFAFKLSTLYNWGYNCAGEADAAHAAVTSYLGCILKNPRVQAAFCSQN